MTKDLTFEAIVDMLDQHRQRATYRAVGDYLGQAHGRLTRGLPRSPRHSWIVNQSTLLPRNYDTVEQHPELEAKPFVLLTEGELRKWLANKATQAARAQRAGSAGRAAS
ncbi:MAG TPA: hypothetical protein VE967_06450 [Gemmatimonadaceae bacterium]|nr:hypothetical protein [Gemmatimonadaceae bacterium]